MVKNRILGLAALLLGFGLVVTQSAFVSGTSTSAEKREKFTFHYQGPTPITKLAVETESNWVLGEDECPTGEAFPCAIEIDRAYVDNPDTAPTLSSSAALVSNPLNPAPIVTGSADNSMAIYNRE